MQSGMNDDECNCNHNCGEDDCEYELIEGKTELDEGEEFIYGVCHPVFYEDAKECMEEHYPGLPLKTDWKHPPKSLSVATNYGAFLLLEISDEEE